MKDPCLEFRARLASALTARPAPAASGLAWHEHLLFCADCRALLDAEEALDDLLKSLPRPKLPPALAQRVLVRLQPTREELELDRLLDDALAAESDGMQAPPPGLAGAVLAGLRDARTQARHSQRDEAALDGLLAKVPPPQPPVGLAARVRSALAHERAAASRAAGREVELPEFHRARPGSRHAAPSIAPALRSTAGRNEAPQRAADRRRFSESARSLLVAASLAALIGGAAWVWAAFGPGSRETVDGEYGPGSVQLVNSERPVRSSDGVDGDSPTDSNRSFLDGQPRQQDVARATDGAAPKSVPNSAPRNASRETPAIETPVNNPAVNPVINLVEPDAELLAQLELLESWDVLTDETLDFELVGIDENTLLGLQTTSSLENDSTPTPGGSDESSTTPKGAGKG